VWKRRATGYPQTYTGPGPTPLGQIWPWPSDHRGRRVCLFPILVSRMPGRAILSLSCTRSYRRVHSSLGNIKSRDLPLGLHFVRRNGRVGGPDRPPVELAAHQIVLSLIRPAAVAHSATPFGSHAVQHERPRTGTVVHAGTKVLRPNSDGLRQLTSSQQLSWHSRLAVKMHSFRSQMCACPF
jgi:hypothetical protein